ncbi:MAG: DUF1295 domain-containing protein [Gammaproteobacteria bacterium]|nr:DUF1295 domain-containing protein [Gammaproteobacteria bacterium]
MVTVSHYLFALVLMLGAGFIVWVISIAKKDVSIVDSLWPLFFIIAAVTIYIQQGAVSFRADLVILLIIIWALRLSLYIVIRHWGHEEDPRYKTIRENNNPGFAYKSLYLIFGFQALIAWLVALPLFFAIESTASFNLFDVIAICLWLSGMWFETVADYQLFKFKQNSANKGKILTTGLWRYTRHPNYFGECLIWWGYFFFAISSSAYIAILSPLLMTFLLLKFSGVGLLEKTMKSRPGYAAYMRHTNAFIPGFGANRRLS